jgi:cell division protein FtsI/penicillin-binding protein 2
MRSLATSTLKYCLLGCLILVGSSRSAPAQINRQVIQEALQSALKGTQAVGVVVNVSDGHLLATVRPQEGAMLRTSPGSILKPLFLAGAIDANEVNPHMQVFCRRDLNVAGRSLPCAHPQTKISFQAEDALAYSCNTYFADLAHRLTPEQAMATLQRYGLAQTTHLFPAEADSKLLRPANMAQLQLLILGLDGVMVTPAQVAVAYRKLMIQLNDSHSASGLEAVRLGLRDSVRYGMAHNADVSGMEILGKTGTASNPGQSWTHGWFAGTVSTKDHNIVVVIYDPRGNGADAAHLAHLFFINWKSAAERG